MTTNRLCRQTILPLLAVLCTAAAHGQSVPDFDLSEVPIFVAIGGSATATATVRASTGVNWEIRNASGAQWLTISPMSGSGTQTITFTVDGRFFTQQGQQSAQVTVTLPGVTTGDFLFVRANVGTGGGASPINANPANVVLNGLAGFTQVGPQFVSLNNTDGSSTGLPFTVSTSGATWLTVTTNSNTTPATLTVTGNQSGLVAGTYQATINVTPFSGAALQIPVTLNAQGTGTTGFAVFPPSNPVLFSWQTGTTAPTPQDVLVQSGTGTQLSWTAFASSNGNWLRVANTQTGSFPSTQATGTTGQYIRVSVDPSNLTNGTYDGTVRVEVPGYSSQTFNVRLVVGTSGTLSASPSSLTFNYVPGASNQLTQTFDVISSTVLTYTVTQQSTGWLSASPSTGSTQSGFNRVNVTVNPLGLANGSYSGNVIITSGTATLTVPVTLNVGTTGSNVFFVSPASLSFTSSLGGFAETRSLSVSSIFGTSEFLVATPESTGGWLSVSPQFTTTPATLNVTVTPSVLLAPGVYSGNIRLQSQSTLASQLIPVTLTISGGVSATPTALSFSGSAGGTSPAAQSVTLSGSSSFTATSSVGWLQVSPTSGTSPTTLSVSANLSGLAAGTHTGQITIVASGQTITIPVTLTLAQSVEVNVSSTALTFSHQTRPGQAAPAAQTVRVTSPAGAAQFTATVGAGATSWLRVSPASGTTPQDLSISVDPSVLGIGTHTGTITVAGPGGGSQRVITVTLSITNPPVGTITAVTNGASLAPTPIAPGLIVTVWGMGFGGGSGIFGQVTGGRLITQLGNTRLLFDGVPAPLLYVGETQINAVVPYAVYGRVNTRLQVEVNGVRSDVVELRVVDSAPAIFSADQSGRGPGAILNQNGTLNTPGNPASRGSVITFWATGEGLVSPAPQDGQIINVGDLRSPVLPVSVSFGGTPFQGGVPGIVQYQGSAPGFVSGSMQVNVMIPANAPTGNNVSLLLTVGSATSPAAITVAIQ